MGVGVVNHTLNIDSIIQTFCLSEGLDFGAGRRGSDYQGWTVPRVRLASALTRNLDI